MSLCNPLSSIETPNYVQSVANNTHRIFKWLAKALIRLRIWAGWSELLLVAHTTLLEISCHGSNHDYQMYAFFVKLQTMQTDSVPFHECTDCHKSHHNGDNTKAALLKRRTTNRHVRNCTGINVPSRTKISKPEVVALGTFNYCTYWQYYLGNIHCCGSFEFLL